MKNRHGWVDEWMSGWNGAGMDAGAGSLCKCLAFTGSAAVEKIIQTRHSLKNVE